MASLCFSIVSPQRSLDLICKNAQDRELCVAVLTALVAVYQRDGKFSVEAD